MSIFNKILIANRAEIALRIMRTAKYMGIETVAIYSPADKGSLHTRTADEAWPLKSNELSDSYLDIEQIIHIAHQAGCDAIHPGYGFLSENADFAQRCHQEKITFIGPQHSIIRLMGNKIESRKIAQKAGVPVPFAITGTAKEISEQKETLPYPVLIKAAAGGGGKGMHLVTQKEDLESTLTLSAREAQSYFGNATVFTEQYIESPRHIEVQIIADHYKKIIHLNERECTIQRRYQKIIEEAPSPTLSNTIREKITTAAIALARTINYENAGTIEFLYDKNDNFYFLEMNTRLQVEHPVTEHITGIDLVEQQIRIAAGYRLNLNQKEIPLHGHSIECRIYAEDPENNFAPSPGQMLLYHSPSHHLARLDESDIHPANIHPFYDSMIAKISTHGTDRHEARKKMLTALNQYAIHGIKTNILYLSAILTSKEFIDNTLSTNFCLTQTPALLEKINASQKQIIPNIPLIGYLIWSLSNNNSTQSIWSTIGYWRNIMEIQCCFQWKKQLVTIKQHQKNQTLFIINDIHYHCSTSSITHNKIDYRINQRRYVAYISSNEQDIAHITLNGHTFIGRRRDLLSASINYTHSRKDETQGLLHAPLPGKLIKINTNTGQTVNQGDIIMIIEAMKMENNIMAPFNARVKKINAKEGDIITVSEPLIELEAISTNS